MGWIGKAVGGAIGFAVGGPVGAAIGVGIGHGVDAVAGEGGNAGIVACPSCGVENASKFNFCKSCGCKLWTAGGDVVACPACGVACNSNFKFCLACGADLPHYSVKTNEQSDLSEVQLECSLEFNPDSVGQYCIFKLEKPIPYSDAFGTVHILDKNEKFVGGKDPFQNSDGAFMGIMPLQDGTADIYLPFGAIMNDAIGTHFLLFEVFSPPAGESDPVPHGHVVFEIELPQKASNRWKVDWLAPLIEVCMKVVRADGKVAPEEVRLVKEYMTQIFELASEDVTQLKIAMKTNKSNSLSNIVAELMQRLPNMHPMDLLELLADIAKSDGEVHPKEVEVIHEVALVAGMEPDMWSEIREVLGLHQVGKQRAGHSNTRASSAGHHDIQHAYDVLGIAPGATKAEITAAYRNLVSDYHPDRVANLPKEFKDVAHEKMTQINAAYEMLKAV
ncbi:MAG: TerB family tellurite resistance protein [Deltaproteobacteria bacterium]|nr:TerB family tellurite resistance protein [Deltaproteobacteria bacterium]